MLDQCVYCGGQVIGLHICPTRQPLSLKDPGVIVTLGDSSILREEHAKLRADYEAALLQIEGLKNRIEGYEELDEVCQQISVDFAREFFKDGEGHIWEAPFTLSKLLEMVRDEFFRRNEAAAKASNQAALDNRLVDRLKYRLNCIRGLLLCPPADLERQIMRLIEDDVPEVKRKCISTYSHSTHGKLTCEKDADHLNRVGDAEHYSGNVKWMSI